VKRATIVRVSVRALVAGSPRALALQLFRGGDRCVQDLFVKSKYNDCLTHEQAGLSGRAGAGVRVALTHETHQFLPF
jgi:hypothetical protein